MMMEARRAVNQNDLIVVMCPSSSKSAATPLQMAHATVLALPVVLPQPSLPGTAHDLLAVTMVVVKGGGIRGDGNLHMIPKAEIETGRDVVVMFDTGAMMMKGIGPTENGTALVNLLGENEIAKRTKRHVFLPMDAVNILPSHIRRTKQLRF